MLTVMPYDKTIKSNKKSSTHRQHDQERQFENTPSHYQAHAGTDAHLQEKQGVLYWCSRAAEQQGSEGQNGKWGTTGDEGSLGSEGTREGKAELGTMGDEKQREGQ